MMYHRYVYAWFKSRERAEMALADYYAAGEVSQGERPRIEIRKRAPANTKRYVITLEDCIY